MNQPDPVEADYERAIAAAAAHGGNDHAQWLTAGLQQYRDLYKT